MRRGNNQRGNPGRREKKWQNARVTRARKRELLPRVYLLRDASTFQTREITFAQRDYAPNVTD